LPEAREPPLHLEAAHRPRAVPGDLDPHGRARADERESLTVSVATMALGCVAAAIVQRRTA
jgi:hypothetical protein